MIGPLVPYLAQAWPPGRAPTAPEGPATQADPAPTASGGPDDPAPPAPGQAGAPVLARIPPADQPAPGRVQPTAQTETPPDQTRRQDWPGQASLSAPVGPDFGRRPAPPPLSVRLNPLNRVA